MQELKDNEYYIAVASVESIDDYTTLEISNGTKSLQKARENLSKYFKNCLHDYTYDKSKVDPNNDCFEYSEGYFNIERDQDSYIVYDTNKYFSDSGKIKIITIEESGHYVCVTKDGDDITLSYMYKTEKEAMSVWNNELECYLLDEDICNALLDKFNIKDESKLIPTLLEKAEEKNGIMINITNEYYNHDCEFHIYLNQGFFEIYRGYTDDYVTCYIENLHYEE